MIRTRPLLSVLTCCYNAEAFLEEAVESVLQQSFRDFEYILVDDGSTDRTGRILARYAAKDERVMVLTTDHSGYGQTKASNIGLAHCRGEWIARLDADDVALPDRLEKQIVFMRTHRNILLLGGGCLEIDSAGHTVKSHTYPQTHQPLMKRLEQGRAFFPHSASLFQKAPVMKLGGYNLKFVRSLDKDLFFRIGESGKMACLPEPIVKIRKHGQRLSTTNAGKTQMIMGMGATICHFRRGVGRSDPSHMDTDVWQRFLRWVEAQMDREGVFQQQQEWQKIRAFWYQQPHPKNVLKLIVYMLSRPGIGKTWRGRVLRKCLAAQWAREEDSFFEQGGMIPNEKVT